MTKRNSGETWRTQAAFLRCQTRGRTKQLQPQLIRYIFPSTHWHLQTCFCTQLFTFSCYLHFRAPPDRSGHFSLSCLFFRGRDSTPKFVTGFTLAGKDAPVSAVAPSSPWAAAGASVQLGRALALSPLPRSGRAHSSPPWLPAPFQLQCRDQHCCRDSSRIPVWGKPCTPGDCCYPPAGAAVTHTAPDCLFCRLFTLFCHLSGLSIKPCHAAAVLWLLQIFQTIYPLLS